MNHSHASAWPLFAGCPYSPIKLKEQKEREMENQKRTISILGNKPGVRLFSFFRLSILNNTKYLFLLRLTRYLKIRLHRSEVSFHPDGKLKIETNLFLYKHLLIHSFNLLCITNCNCL